MRYQKESGVRTINSGQSLQNYPSRAEKVYEILLESITKRRILPGERLVERVLAKKLGVSKTPIREALNRLKEEGLVEGTPYRGYSVAKISLKDIEAIYDLREVLEGLAARKAAEKITKKQIRQLKSILQSLENCSKEKEWEHYYLLDLEFHNLLTAISKNERLFQIARLLENQTKLLMSVSIMLPETIEDSLKEHREILNAVGNHKPDLAEQLAREHIRNVKKIVLASLRKCNQANRKEKTRDSLKEN